MYVHMYQCVHLCVSRPMKLLVDNLMGDPYCSSGSKHDGIYVDKEESWTLEAEHNVTYSAVTTWERFHGNYSNC